MGRSQSSQRFASIELDQPLFAVALLERGRVLGDVRHDLFGDRFLGGRFESLDAGRRVHFHHFGAILAEQQVDAGDLEAHHLRRLHRGVGVGFVADYLARTDSGVVRLLPMLKIPPIPVWLAVHREIRTSKRIRSVYDFLGDNIPNVL